MQKKQKIPMLIMLIILFLTLGAVSALWAIFNSSGGVSIGNRFFGIGGSIIFEIVIILIFLAIIYASIKAKKRGYFLTLAIAGLVILRSIIDITMTRNSTEVAIKFLNLPESLTSIYPKEILHMIRRVSQVAPGILAIMLGSFVYIKRDFFKESGVV